ncbi:hypothetical protein A2U01_0098386, partial [Trifolium medium]|nr:hypothetical protein [Trifolium medium]
SGATVVDAGGGGEEFRSAGGGFQVEVDGRILKELEMSFVGKLAVKVEVRRIKTTLFMEGLSHISVTDMGRDLVLIY